MTIEKLEAKKQEYQQSVEQQQRNIIATQGAIQDIDYWINEIKKEKENE